MREELWVKKLSCFTATIIINAGKDRSKLIRIYPLFLICFC